MAADAAGGLALTYAMLGDLRKASTWLDREAVASPPDGRPGGRIACSGIIARALIAVRSLQGERCAAALADLEQADGQDEMWPFVAYVRANYALMWGDARNALDELDDTWIEPNLLAVANAHGGVAGSLVLAAKAELLMAIGRGNHAKVVLDSIGNVHPLLSVARARLALLTGDNEEAIALANLVPTSTPGSSRLTTPALLPRPPPSRRLSSPIHRMETMIISSIAHHRLGNTTTAGELMRRAVNQADMLGCTRPLACAPRQDLKEIATLFPGVQSWLATQNITALPEIYPEKVALVVLTKREHAILEKLAVGMQIRDIASRSFVSPQHHQDPVAEVSTAS